MSGFPLFNVEYETLKRVVVKLDHAAWCTFLATCQAANDVAMKNCRYFMNVGENNLSIALVPIRNPVQQIKFSFGDVGLEVAVGHDVQAQESCLHRDLEQIRNRFFNEVHIWQCCPVKYHENYQETLFRIARFLKDYRIKGRCIKWGIRDRTEELSEFMRSLDTVKLFPVKLENLDFLIDLPHILFVHSENPSFTGNLYCRSKLVKFTLNTPNPPYHVQEIVQLFKLPQCCPDLYTEKIILNFSMTHWSREPFVDMLCSWFPKHFLTVFEIDPSVELPRFTARSCKIQLFFTFVESERLSIRGKKLPIFIAGFFDVYDFHTSSYRSTVVDVGLKFSLISRENQIEFAPNLPHFPVLANLPPEFIQMKNEICQLLK